MAAELEATDDTFLNYIEAFGAKDLDPTSEMAVEIQAKYIALRGEHPFDTLKSIANNPLCKAADRIAASKALLEYSHRKIPQKIDVSNNMSGTLKIDTKMLSNLTDEQIVQLEELLNIATAATENPVKS